MHVSVCDSLWELLTKMSQRCPFMASGHLLLIWMSSCSHAERKAQAFKHEAQKPFWRKTQIMS